MFIAFIGFQNAGIVVSDSSTCVALNSFNVYSGSATWATIMPMLVTIFGLLAIAILAHKKVRGAVLWGILGSAVAYYVLGLLTVDGFYASSVAPNLASDFFGAFKEFGELSFLRVFKEGFDFSAYIAANGIGSFIVMFITTMLAFCMVDMFDTLGTLYGACSAGNMLTEKGEVPNMNRAMMADAIATCVGAVCGTSTVTTFVESSSGISEGGRTGLASLVTATLFFIAMFLAPVAQLIPTYATATALIYVGVLMMSGVKNIAWDDPAKALPGFLTIAVMVFTYNISYGIAFGLISCVVIKVFSGKAKELSIATWIIAILFALTFFLTH
ncbi:MAG TPA: NCS2 family permease [Candidatus Avoscillospira stercoripullorum]|uniref:NCS2 family permease n=1 Tax=Candidatus Avoscillospira stercoripullorum TaxID=2840709 RepID=A0A9D1A814_9FIRM|nr:NCS2 family permease [Candidatus Avoscillospira stercoripullorum]